MTKVYWPCGPQKITAAIKAAQHLQSAMKNASHPVTYRIFAGFEDGEYISIETENDVLQVTLALG